MAGEDDPGALEALVAASFPDLAGAALRPLPGGWDCMAVEVGGWVVKVPRDADAAARLEGESRLLAALHPFVTMAVPDLRVVGRPRLVSRHAKVEGGVLLGADYAALPVPARDRLADDLARLLGELHAIPVARMHEAGAAGLDLWLPGEAILRRVRPLLPEALHGAAEATVQARERLPPDPWGQVFGHFDAHGWNMAFDHAGERLNGVFDFGDAGIADLHQEFVAPSLVSADLTKRLLVAYERRTGRALDRERVWVLTGSHRLWELAVEADEPANLPGLVDLAVEWLACGPG